jgi:ABC-2 type transport system permease protein
MKLFWSFTRQSFHSTAVYRFEFWMQLVTVFLMMYSVRWIWSTLYTQSPGAFGVSLSQMVTYGILGMAFETIFNPGRGPQTYMASQVKTGAIDLDLMKPLDFMFHMLARNFGETLFRFCTLAVPSMLIGFLLLGLQPPAGLDNGLLFAVSVALGYLLLFSLNYMLGMLAMITLNINSISWGYNAMVRFFSGQMVPLWLFPGFVGVLASVLPFRGIYSIPISIYIGQLSGAAAWEGILFQCLWIGALMLMNRLAWRQVHARLVVQGG